jgi:hypothetical protein
MELAFFVTVIIFFFGVWAVSKIFNFTEYYLTAKDKAKANGYLTSQYEADEKRQQLKKLLDERRKMELISQAPDFVYYRKKLYKMADFMGVTTIEGESIIFLNQVGWQPKEANKEA